MTQLLRDTRSELARLAREQDGVVSREQLRSLGVSRFQVRDQVSARRWQLAGARVVVLHTGPLTTSQRRWVGVLHAGAAAALTGLTALEIEGLRGFEGDVVHVVVPHGRSVPPLDGYEFHCARRLEDDVHPVLRPPRVRRVPAVLVAVTEVADDLRACALVAAAAQQGVVRADDLRRALLRKRTHPRRRLLLQLCDDVSGGAHSLGELDAVRMCRRLGLPAPHCQVRLDDGRRRYLDLHWRKFGVTAEIDGAYHREAGTWWADMERQNEVVLATCGIVLRFPSVVVRLFPERVADQFRRALLAGGWQGGRA